MKLGFVRCLLLCDHVCWIPLFSAHKGRIARCGYCQRTEIIMEVEPDAES